MPPVVLERPKMSRAIWESLKSHILRERQRKKQELEADAEVERLRKERERQQKQDSMTLSQTNEQISKLNDTLSELKEEKHQLFLQLKKVLNEDETRRRQLISKEANEMMSMHNYLTPSGVQVQQQQQPMFLQTMGVARPPLYKVGPASQPHTQHTLLPPGTLKRSRSPSPPPHNYKFGPFKPPPHALHSYPHKPPMAMGLPYYHGGPGSQQQQQSTGSSPHGGQQQDGQSQHQRQPQQPHGVTFSSAHQQMGQQPPTLYTYSSSPVRGSGQVQLSREENSKHLASGSGSSGIYMHPGQGVPRGFLMQQQPMEHSQSPQKFGDENPKYYPPPPHQAGIRQSPHMTLHPGLTIQAQGPPTGSLTSGYPIRTSQSVSSYQVRPPSPHVIYTGPSGGGAPRMGYGHPQHGQGTPVSGTTLTRYSVQPGGGMTRDRE